MKKKIFLFIALVIVFTFVFAFSVCAEEFSVTYRDIWGNVKETVKTDGSGQITFKETGYTNHTGKTLFGWYNVEGDVYDVGETATLTTDLDLYEAYGYNGTYESIKYQNVTQGRDQWDQVFVRLQENIVIDSRIAPPWGGRVIIDLNGYSITSSYTNLFDEQRAGVILVGEGSVIHTGTGNFFNASTHGYGDGNQRLIVGKDVTISTNGTLLSYGNGTNSVVPIHILGKATCAKVCHISTLNHTLDIRINAKDLTVTGDVFMTVGAFGENGVVAIDILNGNLKLSPSANTKDYWNNSNSAEQKDLFNITISGGTFNYGIDVIEDYIVDGYKMRTFDLNGLTYATIILDGGCDHNYEITASSKVSCISLASETYTCSLCNDTYTVTYGTFIDHVWVLTKDTLPTPSSIGEKLYTCEVCNETRIENYYLDIANEEITVIVNTEEGEKEVTVKVSDIFVLESVAENQYKLTDIKEFNEYAVTDFVSISIPIGIVEINFASSNSTLKNLIILDGANVVIKSFSKYTALTHIEIQSSTVEFVNKCSNNVIESIKSEKENAFVVFDEYVFDGKSSFKEIKLSTNSKYIFGKNSFRYTSITEFIAPDYSEVIFKSEAAFYKCNSLEYIYIGRGIKYLEGKPFDYCQYVQKIVLMDVKAISTEYTFCVEDSGEKPVEVYIHSDSISLPNNTFYQCNGVIIYTNAPITNASVFNNCKEVEKNGVLYPAYTIYYGIPHKLVETYEDPTCTEVGVDGYATDCPCGEKLATDTYVMQFNATTTNSDMHQEILYSSQIIPATGHFEGEVIHIEYLNGYLETGLKDCVCRVCGEEYTELSPTADPLFVFLGYSMPEDGRLEIAFGFSINNSMIDLYETLSEKELNYGTVLALESNLNGKAPLDDEVIASTQKAEISRNFAGITLKVSGFTEDLLDVKIVMAIYVTKDGKTVYLQEEQTELPTSISINSLNS